MGLQESGNLEYFRFSNFHDRVTQAIFTRKGGISPYPWLSLNLGGTVGDTCEHVIENRRRMFSALNIPVESLFDVWQVHSADVICSDHPRPLDQPHKKADAILTNQPGVTLFMRFADCVPILLHDPQKEVVGLVHAGWQGTVKKVVQSAVLEMNQVYGSQPENIQAGIGPSIGPDHYEIGSDVTNLISGTFGQSTRQILRSSNGNTFLDLWRANQVLLEDVGVKSIEISGFCTACDINRWYSHRAEKGKTGRFGALIRLNPALKEEDTPR